MRNQNFFALYTTWAIVWTFVAVSYSKATYKSWRAQDGKFRYIPREIAGFVRWFFWGSYQDVRHGFHEYSEEIPSHYTTGHLLRFFITLGAFVCGVMGLLTSMVDRSHWSVLLTWPIAVAVTLSICAALGHLSVSWVFCPRKWRLLVVGLMLWFPTAWWIRGALL